MASEDSDLIKTAMKAVDGYNKWNIDAILEPRAPNCTQQVLPARLERPQLNNSEYREYFSTIMPLFKGFHIEVMDITEDSKRHQVALHAKSQAETALGAYANEYVILMRMTEDHQKVVEIKEFVDSGYSADYFQRLRALGSDTGTGN